MFLTKSDIFNDYYQESEEVYIHLEELDTYPFTSGIGINALLAQFLQNNDLFSVSKYTKNKKRKEKMDNIRKKIKTNFHKKTREVINKILKDAGSKTFFFESFPQCFIADIRLKINHDVFQIAYKDLFEYTYQISLSLNYDIEETDKDEEKIEKRKNRVENEKKITKRKYEKNLKTLEFLNSKEGSEICKLAKWEIIANMKYEQLLERFFNSLEFEMSIKKLEEKENKNY